MFKVSKWRDFRRAVGDLLENETVLSMKNYRHHHFVNCYEHSVFVAYVSFLMARRLGLDEVAAARGGMLHDFYLYDSQNPDEYEGFSALYHPPLALENAEKVCDLTDKERNIILSHMWPISKVAPKSAEAAVVCAADKYCAALEVSKIWHKMQMAVHVKAAQL